MFITGAYDEQDWYGDVEVDGKLLTPRRSLEVFNHSPDGFGWGYGGSGPAQLALALLLEAGLHNDDAVALHQKFKFQFLAPLPRAAFGMHVDVVAWASREGLRHPVAGA